VRESKFPLRIAFLTHEPFYPPSGGGSAEAVYLVEEMVRRGHEVHVFCPQITESEAVKEKFRIHLHQFSAWQMGRYARLRNFKYLLYPSFLERMVARAARTIKFDLLLSQHAISAVAAGRLKRRLNVPVVMNFPDLLTGFMETWPAYIAPRPFVEMLERFEISMPVRYGVDGVLAISDTLADYFVERGYPRERVLPIYYGYAAEYFPFYVRMIAPNRPPVVVMHGSLDFHHLGDIAFGAIRHVTQNRPGTVFRFVGQRVGNRQHPIHAVTDGHGNFVAFEHLNERTGRDVGRPGFHETGEEVGKIHHDRHVQPVFQPAGGHGGNRVLREQQIEFYRARGPGNQALQKRRIEQVFEIPQPGITAHLPGGELMQMDAEFFFDGFGFGDLRAKNVDFVAAPDHFFDQINGLRRAAAGRWIKRFMGQKRDTQREFGFAHAMTLCNFGRAIQS